MTLTAQQIAEGWIAHDGGPCPVPQDTVVEALLRSGGAFNDRAGVLGSGSVDNWRQSNHADWGGLDVMAYRVVGRSVAAPKPQPALDPNAAMLARDERTYDVDAMAGSGCIFPPACPERCNLLVVADIPRTGFSLWGV